MFPHTVTIYNVSQETDPATFKDVEKTYITVLRGVLLEASKAANVRQSGLEGADAVTWYKASSFARRGFCGTCGSALFWEAEEGDFISILAGAFDTPLDVRIGRHIFCADKPAFYEIAGDAPQYPAGSPGLAVATP